MLRFLHCFSYHHTVSSTLLYGLRESLSLICKEGLENVIERHQRTAKALHSGLAELGLQLYIKDANNRLPTINAVKIPREYDWMKIVEIAANKYVVYPYRLKRMSYPSLLLISCTNYNLNFKVYRRSSRWSRPYSRHYYTNWSHGRKCSATIC